MKYVCVHSHGYFPIAGQTLATESKLLKICVCNLNIPSEFGTNNQILVFV